MNHVADMFDKNSRGLIDWKEFIAALRPDWEEKTNNDAQKIHDEVKRLVMLCTCRQKFRVFQVGEGKYRVNFCFVLFDICFIFSLFYSLVIVKNCALCVFYAVPLWYVLEVVGLP